ncbi:MAG: hypothetical protein HZB10_03405 [Candidatus Yonathbacteria bacterium]|nr:hypothetical protein [Candidatus Yonathbacteria bacterium]
MEHAPQPHHREGIQEQLDKAYDEGHRDNEAIDTDKIVRAEMGHVDDKEMRGVLSLEETTALLKEKGYLDTSFEWKEVHELEIEPFSKEEALDEYKSNGGIVWPTAEELIAFWYETQREGKSVEVLTLNKNCSDDELREMGVRSISPAEVIQYGIRYPEHQSQNVLLSSGGFSLHANNYLIGLAVVKGKRAYWCRCSLCFS